MKLVAFVSLLGLGLLVFAKQDRQVPVPSGQVMLWAQQEIRAGPLIRLRGNVHIATNSVSIEADEADYNPITGSLDPRGHVHVSLKNVSPHLKIQENSPEDLPAKFR
jgi:hypothetical protein